MQFELLNSQLKGHIVLIIERHSSHFFQSDFLDFFRVFEDFYCFFEGNLTAFSAVFTHFSFLHFSLEVLKFCLVALVLQVGLLALHQVFFV